MAISKFEKELEKILIAYSTKMPMSTQRIIEKSRLKEFFIQLEVFKEYNKPQRSVSRSKSPISS